MSFGPTVSAAKKSFPVKWLGGCGSLGGEQVRCPWNGPAAGAAWIHLHGCFSFGCLLNIFKSSTLEILMENRLYNWGKMKKKIKLEMNRCHIFGKSLYQAFPQVIKGNDASTAQSQLLELTFNIGLLYSSAARRLKFLIQLVTIFLTN